MAAFHPFFNKRPFQPKSHQLPPSNDTFKDIDQGEAVLTNQIAQAPCHVLKGAGILTPTKPRRQLKKSKAVFAVMCLGVLASLAVAPWVMAQESASQEDASQENSSQENSSQENAPKEEIGQTASTGLLSPVVSADSRVVLDVYDAITGHPSVQSYRAQVCQARSQVDLARAGRLPQISGRLVGGSSLSSHIEKQETNRRRFDDREIDAVISLEQTIYDWGIAKAGEDIAENSRQSALLGILIEQDRIAADIISTMLTYAELEAHNRLYDDHRQQVDALAMQIEAGVEAGVNRLADLRVIKVLQLDQEIAQTQVQRQLTLIEADLLERFRLDFNASLPLLVAYRAHKPEVIPTIASMTTREVKRIDFELSSTVFEINRLKAELKPRFSASLDTTFFDADSFSQEYELAGRLNFTMPLYDGGGNKARQRETQWRSRGLASERDNTIRNHRSQMEQVFNQIKRLDGEMEKNTAKIIEINHQIDGAKAREGLVESNPLEMANLLSQRFGFYLAQETLAKERDIEELRGIYFSDALGRILNLNHGGTSC